MTDIEIIKALDCCNRIGGSCEICPLYQGTLYCGTTSCIKDMALNALDLISCQKEKIKEFDGKIVIQQGMIDYQKAENERLLQKLQRAKSEAIKEFADRLKSISIGLEIGDDKKLK